MNWRIKSEQYLESIALQIYLNPIKIILLVMLVSASLIFNITKVTIDTSTEGFLHADDPSLIRYEEFKKQFGYDEMILIAIKTKDIFDINFLTKLKSLHNELKENTPHLNDINSLINARNTRGDGDRLIVEDLFENWPRNEQELSKIKKIAMESELYKNLLLNSSSTMTTILIEPNVYESSENGDDLAGFGEDDSSQKDAEFISDKSKGEMIDSTNKIVQKYHNENFDVYIAGSLSVNDTIKKSIQKDMQKFVMLALIMMLIFLFVVFKRFSGVFLPIFIVVLSLVSTIGVMGLTGVPITIPSQILPSFLLAVGIGATVHILAMFFKEFNKSGSRKDAIVFSLGHSGLAVIMTSLTTAAGLLSFSTAEIAPIANLGVFAAVGIMIALFNTIILMPAILSILPLKIAKEKHTDKSELMDKILLSIANFSYENAKSIVVIGISIFLVSLYFALGVEFKHDPLGWLPEESASVKATYLVDKELNGSVSMEVIIDTKKENGLYDSELLNKIDLLRKKTEQINRDDYYVGKGWSVAEVLKEIHRALHENSQDYYKIADNSALIPQEFLLFENSGSDDLEDLVDSSFSKARLTLKLPWMEASRYSELGNEVKSLIKSELGDDVEVSITGMVPLFQRTLVAAMNSMALSYITAFFVISLIMIVILGSFKVGMISMIPNVLPVVMALGFMNFADMPLDIFTMLVGAIIIGLSVDDTVHYFYNFGKYHSAGDSIKVSIEKTMIGTGWAMVATTIVLSLGFYIYMFATMSNLVHFGILTGGAIIIALLSDILLAPALLKLTTKENK
ncbi:MMPL family transporter [Sulfurimonas sp.]|nr:MMPL family transporter [Sulfurimonas sp.]